MISAILLAHCFFVPPKGWDLVHPEKLQPHTRVAFVHKTATINLSTEETDVSLATYIEAVKRDHKTDPNHQWRDLGKLNTKLGEGQLTEIEIKGPHGTMRQMQLIALKGGVAYILTASATKGEFSSHFATFEKSFQSLECVQDLKEALSPAKKTELETLIGKKLPWKTFQERIINDFTEMGPYWQTLFLLEQMESI